MFCLGLVGETWVALGVFAFLAYFEVCEESSLGKWGGFDWN